MGPLEESPEPTVSASADRLAERTVDQIASREVRICDACRESQLFGCAVGVRLGFTSFEICAECAAKLCEDLNRVRSWRPQKPEEAPKS